MDGWCIHGCTFFVPPCPWANQGGELKLIFFFHFLNLGWFFFWEFFYSSPPTPAQVSPTYLPLNYYLCTLPSFPHLPTYLPTYPPIYLPSHQPIYLCTYALNLHQGNDDVGQWRYCNIPSRLFHFPSFLPP